MIDMKLKLSGYTYYGKIYRLVLNRQMSTFTMVRWCPILKQLEICYNLQILPKRFLKHVAVCYKV